MRAVIDESLATVRSLPWVLAMAVVRRDLGPRSPWGRFRVAVERFDARALRVLARRRAEARDDSMLALLLEARDERRQPAERSALARSAGRAARRRPRQLGGGAGVGVRAPGPQSAGAGAAARGRSGIPRGGREGGAAGPAGADDRATPAARAGGDRRTDGAGRRPGCGLPVARLPARGSVAARASEFRPERWIEARTARRRTRCRGSRSAAASAAAPARRSRRWRCARCFARRRPDAPSGPTAAGVGPAEHARAGAEPGRRGARRLSPRPVRRDSVHARDASDTRQHGPGGHAARARAGRARPPRLHQPRPRIGPGRAHRRRVDGACRARGARRRLRRGRPLLRRGAILRPGRGVPGELARAARPRARRRHGRLEVGLHVHRRLARRREVNEVKDLSAATLERQLDEVARAARETISRLYQIHSATVRQRRARRPRGHVRARAAARERHGDRVHGDRTASGTDDRARARGRRASTPCRRRGTCSSVRLAPRWRRLTPRDWA